MVTKRKDRKRGVYRVRGTVGGVKFDRSFTVLEDAKRFELKIRRERELVEAGIAAPQEKILIRDYSETWLAIRKREVQPPTYAADEKNLRLHVLPYMGMRPIQAVSTVEWKKFLEFVMGEHELSNATHNRVRATVQAIYKDALSNGVVVQNPIDGVPARSEKVKTRKTEFWRTDEEILTFLSLAERASKDFKLYAYIALNTGPRVSEISALEWRDVDFKSGVILLNKIYEQESGKIRPRTKSGEGVDRYVPITDALRDVLLAHKGRPSERIVKLNPDQLAREQDRILEGSGLSRVTPHGLRKTYATWFRRHGGAKDDLQAILGHSSPMVTDIYAINSRENVAAMKTKGVGIEKIGGANVVQLGGKKK